METLMLRAIFAVAVILALLLLAYVGLRIRDWNSAHRATACLREAEDRLTPLVFTDSSDYDRSAAALLAQARHLAYTLKALRKADKPVRARCRTVDRFMTDVEAYFEGEDVVGLKRGTFLRGYVSDIDDTLQTYSIHVPPAYDGERPWPLLVHLHGHGKFKPFQGHPAPAMDGAIVLSPEGRRATDFMWIGEVDVLKAIEEVRRGYLVDERRIIVSGTSMGGTGAWHLGVHHPHLFTGIGPRAGNCDFKAWEGRWGWNRQLAGQHRELRDFLLESDSPITYVRNLAQTPAYVVHAASDPVVPVEHAREAVRRLRATGAAVEYREYLVGRHGGFPKHVIPDQLAWLTAHPRAGAPARYHFETRDLRHGRSHYVTIEQMMEALKGATLDVSLEGDRLEIETANVQALSILPADLPVPERAERVSLALKLDGQSLRLEASREAGPVHFVRTEGTWGRSEVWPVDDSPRKLRGLEGPVSNVFLSPFIVVGGTGGRQESWHTAAMVETARFAYEWTSRFGAPCKRTVDLLVTKEMLRSRNIVFFGWPGEGTLMKKVLAQLPIRLGEDGITVNGESFSGGDVGTIFCYPTPGGGGRMIAVFTATTPEALYQAYDRFGNWFNWGVYDQRKWFDYCVYDGRTANPETYPVVGFFGTDWSFERGRKWRPTPEALARVRPQGVPVHATPPDADVLYLSELKPARIIQTQGAVGFDRSYRGNAIVIGGRSHDRGLGVRCPSEIRFALDGKFKRLSAVVGLTEEPEEALSTVRLETERTRFTVLGDRRVLHTEDVDWQKNEGSIDVDVKGVRELILLVRPLGGASWLHGSSAWADIKVERY